MTTMYLACKTLRAMLPGLAGLPSNVIGKEGQWDSPILDDDAMVFASRTAAESYCMRMNGPKDYISLLPYSDFIVIPIELGDGKLNSKSPKAYGDGKKTNFKNGIHTRTNLGNAEKRM